MPTSSWSPTDRTTVADALTRLATAYGRPLSPTRLALYLDHLTDLPADAVTAACTTALLSERFFPTLATLRDLATAAARPTPAPRRRDPTTPPACPTCHDLRWLYRTSDGRLLPASHIGRTPATVRPCPTCHPRPTLHLRTRHQP